MSGTDDGVEADPVLIEILSNKVDSLMDQALETMVLTARSPVISEIVDCTVDLWDAEGRMLGVASAIPIHLQSLQSVLDRCLVEIPPTELEPGDVVITNDPYRGDGQHLPDVAMIEPIFFDGSIVGYAGSMAHQQDIGGKTPGGMPEYASEIYEEGLRIPPIKLVEGGDLNEDLVDLIVTNSRTDDDDMWGDLRAQIASCEVARSGYVDVIEKYGRDVVKAQEAAWLAKSERKTRNVVETFPDGRYTFEDTVEAPSRDHVIRVAVEIEGSDVRIDYEGTDPEIEEAPINSTMAATEAMSLYAMCTLLPSDVPKNGGTLSVFDVTAPSGSLVNPVEPRACSNRNLIGHRIPDLIYGALSEAAPDRVMAACYGSTCGVSFYFRDDDGFKSVGGINPGGWGATAAEDGEHVLCAAVSNTISFEMEAAERAGPIFVDRYAFREGSGGHGTHRGGMGLDYRLRFQGEDGTVTFSGGRHRNAPFGLHGGESGAKAVYRIRRSGEDEWTTVGANEILPVEEGDEIWYRSAGGGGFGDPRERDPGRVREDVEHGVISAEMARAVYGVEIDPEE